MDYKENFKNGGGKKEDRPALKVLKVVAMIILGIGLFLLATYLLMALWNWLMPEIFGLPTLGFWQTLGVFVLAKLLFGFGGGGHKGQGGRRHKNRFKSSQGQGCSMGNGWEHWKHYDRFWEEEGEEAFKAYVQKRKGQEPGEP